MKIKFKVLGCFFGILLMQCGLSLASICDFFYAEEQCYVEALNRRIKHISSPGVNLQQDEDFKLMFFEFKVYGAWFGSGSIRRTVEYYLLLKRLGMGDSEEARLIETQIKVWGRKVGFSILTDYDAYPVQDREAAVRLFEMIEGLGRWGLWKDDAGYSKAAKRWVDGSVAPKSAKLFGGAALEIQKILNSVGTEVCIPLDCGKVMRGMNYVSIQDGCVVSGLGGSFYVEIPNVDLNALEWGQTCVLDEFYARTMIAWKSGECKGLVQMVAGRRQEGRYEMFVFKQSGVGERLPLGPVVAKLDLEDVRLLALRGELCVGHFSGAMYTTGRWDFWRWGLPLNAGEFWGTLSKNGGDISGMEDVLILHAKKLPLARGLPVLKKYDELVSRYK